MGYDFVMPVGYTRISWSGNGRDKSQGSDDGSMAMDFGLCDPFSHKPTRSNEFACGSEVFAKKIGNIGR